jgi:hypothetical protein
MHGALQRIGAHDLGTRLVAEQVHGVRGVMPQQVVSPAARLAQRVDVSAPEEVGLHIHLLDGQLTREDAPVDPLVRRIEAARVAHHAHQAAATRGIRHGLGVAPAVRERDLHLHVFARGQALQRLRGMHLRGRAQDDGIHARLGERLTEVRGGMRHAVLARHFFGGRELPSNYRGHLDAADLLDGIQVLGAEGTGARQYDSHVWPPAGSRMRWPTAVFDAGTW